MRHMVVTPMPKAPVAAKSQQVNKDEANTIVAPSVSNPVVGGLLLGLFTMPKDSTLSPPADLIERAEALSNLGDTKVAVEIARVIPFAVVDRSPSAGALPSVP